MRGGRNEDANKYPFISVTIAACVVGCLAAIMFRNEFHALSSDAGQHYALVRLLMDLDGWIRPPASYIGPLNSYPPVAHWIAAELGKLVGSGLLGMTLVASASVALFYVALFSLAARLGLRVTVIACAIMVGYALVRGPVFGRQIVNNYFFAQTVGSTIGIWTLLVVFSTAQKWKGALQDIFVLVIGQLLVATHLTPAFQLIAAYCVILALQAWKSLNWVTLLRVGLFAGASLACTTFNPYARLLLSVAQEGGGAHVNHLLGQQPVQLLLFIVGGYACVSLISKQHEDQEAVLILGGIGLSLCAAGCCN